MGSCTLASGGGDQNKGFTNSRLIRNTKRSPAPEEKNTNPVSQYEADQPLDHLPWPLSCHHQLPLQQAPHLPHLGSRPWRQHFPQSSRTACLCGQPPARPAHPHRHLPAPPPRWRRLHPRRRPRHCHRAPCRPPPLGTRQQWCLCLQRGSHGNRHPHPLPSLLWREPQCFPHVGCHRFWCHCQCFCCQCLQQLPEQVQCALHGPALQLDNHCHLPHPTTCRHGPPGQEGYIRP